MTQTDNPPPTLSTEQALAESEKTRAEIEALALKIRELIIAQPPIELLGYVWAQFAVRRLKESRDIEEQPSDSDLTRQFQHTLEYMHAVWSTTPGHYPTKKLDESKAKELLICCSSMANTAMMHAMASSVTSASAEFGTESRTVEFQAKTSWLIIRGHRYQVLEKEFFEFVLAPHDDALQQAYGTDSHAIALGIQTISDSLRVGFSNATLAMQDNFAKHQSLSATRNLSKEEAIAELRSQDPEFDTKMTEAWADVFMGGICNLSKKTQLPSLLLADLSYEFGEEQSFFADGPYKGTPFRRLPARVRPLIRLGADYYATDPQFVRDSAYRAIQWALLKRLPAYRDTWARSQSKLVERSFPKILKDQLSQATFFEEVYFKDPETGEWVETDLVGVVDDVLLVIESKGGVMAMHSPATNYQVHVRTIQSLVVEAFNQCRRFLEYLSSAREVALFRLVNGQHEQVALLKRESFRLILPIGLTIESFTPFSSMCKALPEVKPLLGVHPFISMSVDDLFVLRRFLPTAGELFHYLEVRQAIAGIVQAHIFDELDHLGAYITKNRFDQNLTDMLETASMVTTASFSDVVDRHFEREDWQTRPPPRQVYPVELQALLDALNRIHPKGWLRADAHLRNYGDEGRKHLETQLLTLSESLKLHPVRRIGFNSEPPLQIWICREGSHPHAAEIERQGMISCLTFEAPSTLVVCVEYNSNRQISNVTTQMVIAPLLIRGDYKELDTEAQRQKKRLIDLQ
ncbi:hypothetical protein LJ725_14805 [Reyranella aquatilis]|uniref:NERD domain-containing protein n=1 Tax=Reyranella aquatilis TaxID=2035356 RepID=A0ABS8KW04_9HYPH|nr:hypothetical protein [Reyranella aquatilis]MCC8430243.1 hypothetical protein [Reyranella aquatilis]